MRVTKRRASALVLDHLKEEKQDASREGSRVNRIIDSSSSPPNHELALVLQSLRKLKLRGDPSVLGDEKVRSDGRELGISSRRGKRDLLEEEGREEEFVAWEVRPGRDVVAERRCKKGAMGVRCKKGRRRS